jgi:lysophospholipase L1-like esterase
MKNFVFGLLTTIVGLLVAVGIMEVYVRMMHTDGSNFDIEMWRYARELKQVSTIEGGGHEHVPGGSGLFMGVPVLINSVGWRDDEYPVEKTEGVPRIMMLGDSLAFGWGAAPEDVTSYRLETLLNNQAGGRKYEVLNTGIGNTNTAMQTAVFLNKYYRYKPDIVVLNYFINDAEITPKRRESFFLENFYSAVFFGGRYDLLTRQFFGKTDWRTYYQDLYRDDQPGWTAAKQALQELSRYCEEQGIELVVVHYPELHELGPYPFQGVTDLVQEESEKAGRPFLDLLPVVIAEEPTSLWVTPTDAHPNGKAAGLYAKELKKFLQETFPDLI